MKILISAAIFAALSFPAIADDQYLTPGSPVAGHPDLTYAQLLKQVIPDLAEDASSGHLPDGMRHVDDQADGEAPDSVSIPNLTVEHVQVDGKPTLWILADLGGGGTLGTYTLLAVFSDEAQPKLIDAAEVDEDRFTNFIGDPLRISATDEVMLVDSNHFNSEQNYSSQQLLLLRGGKLSIAASFLVFGVHSCHMHQEEALKLNSKPAGNGYWPISAVITRSLTKNKDSAEACVDDTPATAKVKTFQGTFTWNEAKGTYETTSKAFEQLQKADEGLF